MKAGYLLLALVLLAGCSDNANKNESLVFELRIAETQAKSGLQEMTLYQSGEKFYVGDSIFLSNKHIRATDIVEWQSRPQIKVELTPEGTKIFFEFTSNHVGRSAAMLIDSKLISAPRINAPIPSGTLLIVGSFSHEEAVRFARGIAPKE